MTNKEPVGLETVSEERLAEILAGLKGVTPGPWHHSRKHEDADILGPNYEVGSADRGVAGQMHALTAAHIARLDPATVRPIISELLASRLAIQAPDGWQTTEPPKDGTPVYIRTVQPYRYMPYKAASQQYKRGEKGRWQVMNEYGGWENSHPLGGEWRLESPFLAPNLGATK